MRSFAEPRRRHGGGLRSAQRLRRLGSRTLAAQTLFVIVDSPSATGAGAYTLLATTTN